MENLLPVYTPVSGQITYLTPDSMTIRADTGMEVYFGHLEHTQAGLAAGMRVMQGNCIGYITPADAHAVSRTDLPLHHTLR